MLTWHAQGVYVLTDNSFRPFARMSTEAGGQAVVKAQPVREVYYLNFLLASAYPINALPVAF